jgi:hypothetical protein
MFLLGTKIEMSKDGEATPTVTITILNASQFPMKSLLAEIQFVPVQNDCNGKVSFESKSSSRLVKNIPTSTQSLFDGESELLPEEKHLEIITVWSSCLAQYNGNITVSVLSPGTGQKLQAYHKFGLYIIDQVGNLKRDDKSAIHKYSCLIASSRNRSIYHMTTYHLQMQTEQSIHSIA